MKLKLAALCTLAAFAGAHAVTPASAATLNWNFYSLTGMPASPGSTTWPGQSTASPTATFSQAGVDLYVEAATSSGCSAPYSQWCPGSGDLYAKNGGPGEQGLGLTNDPYPYDEIGNPYGIYLNPSQGYISSVQLGSVQSGETWSIWGSDNPNGYSWTLLGSGMGGGTVNFTSPKLAGYDQLIIADPYLYNLKGGNSNDVVLESITTVPEPGTLALFAAGLLGCALFLRRRARQS